MAEWVHCRRNGACEVQCQLCAEEQRQMATRAEGHAPAPAPLPAAPAGPVGTDQGAIRPDLPRFRWPRVRKWSR